MKEFKEIVEDHKEGIKVVEGVVGAYGLEKVARGVIDLVPARAGLGKIHTATVDFGAATDLLGPHTSQNETLRGVVHHRGPVVPADPVAATKVLEKGKNELQGVGVKPLQGRVDQIIRDIAAKRQHGSSEFGQQIGDIVSTSTGLGPRVAELEHVRSAQYGLMGEGAAIALAIPMALAGAKKALAMRARRNDPAYERGWVARGVYNLFNPAFTRRAPEQPQRELVERT